MSSSPITAATPFGATSHALADTPQRIHFAVLTILKCETV